VVLPAVSSDLLKFKEILQQYAAFSGLKVNYHKSSIIPINMIADEASSMATIFDCQLGSMPFTYLGLPMGTTKPSIRDLSPLIDSVERRLSSTASFLSYGDRLVLVNSVLSSLPTYIMLTLVIPVGVLEVIDRARRHCLWRRKDKEKINSLAAWDMVCKPKKKGGMGIINLKLQNAALLLKHLHKFYNNYDTPWVKLIKDTYYHGLVPHVFGPIGSFWWRNVLSLADTYRVVTKCSLGSGNTVLLWSDLWHTHRLENQFPRLMSFAKDKLQSVQEFSAMENYLHGFYLPLSAEAHQKLQQLQTLMQS
jgi:hypothetical protein